MTGATAGLPGRSTIAGGRYRRLPQRRRQLVERLLIETNQRALHFARCIQQIRRGYGLRVPRAREREFVIELHGIANSHLLDEVVRGLLVILRYADDLHGISGQSI